MTRVFFSAQVCWHGSGWLSLVGKAAGLRELVSGCCVGGWLVCSYRWGWVGVVRVGSWYRQDRSCAIWFPDLSGGVVTPSSVILMVRERGSGAASLVGSAASQLDEVVDCCVGGLLVFLVGGGSWDRQDRSCAIRSWHLDVEIGKLLFCGSGCVGVLCGGFSCCVFGVVRPLASLWLCVRWVVGRLGGAWLWCLGADLLVVLAFMYTEHYWQL